MIFLDYIPNLYYNIKKALKREKNHEKNKKDF